MRDNWFDKAKVLAYCVRSEEVWPPWEQCLPGESPVDEIVHALKSAYNHGYESAVLDCGYESQRPVNEAPKR